MNKKNLITDFEYLDAILKQNQTGKIQILQTYLIETPDFISRTNYALKENNFDEIYFYIHRLNSSITYVGLDNILSNQISKMQELSSLKIEIEDIKKCGVKLCPSLKKVWMK